MTLKPANPGFGYQFQRTDLPGSPTIKADCDLVTDTSRGTTLVKGDCKVSTVEHILAALVGMGVDNCLIELNGPEIPIIDGSSGPFVNIIEKTGVIEQDAAKIWYTIDTNISYFDDEKKVEMTAMPAVNYQITTLIDFNSPVLGTQHASLKSMKEFQISRIEYLQTLPKSSLIWTHSSTVAARYHFHIFTPSQFVSART